MTFHEMCEISEIIVGEAAMSVVCRFLNGEIPFEQFLENVCEVIPPENAKMLEVFVDIVSGRRTLCEV